MSIICSGYCLHHDQESCHDLHGLPKISVTYDGVLFYGTASTYEMTRSVACTWLSGAWVAVKGIIGFIWTLPRAQPGPTTRHYLQVSNTGEESERLMQIILDGLYVLCLMTWWLCFILLYIKSYFDFRNNGLSGVVSLKPFKNLWPYSGPICSALRNRKYEYWTPAVTWPNQTKRHFS